MTIPQDLPGIFGSSNVQIFNTPTTVVNTNYSIWKKPIGCVMGNMFCLGGGGGGGGGFTRASGNGGGGGGGGSSGSARLVIPLIFLPDILYIQVGAGGIGVSSGGGTAGSGILSRISVSPSTSTNAINQVLQSGNAASTGGGTGTVAAVGAVGNAGTIASLANCTLAGLGISNFVAGQDGALGGAVTGAVGGPCVFPTTGSCTTGGGGGAGTSAADFSGSAWTAVAGTQLSEQRPDTPAAGTVDGFGGHMDWKLLYSWAGGGGSSSNAGAGGNGGNAGYGSGGGGGGAGTTGGKGGDGGCGLVIITCW